MEGELARVARFREVYDRLVAETHRVIVGQDDIVQSLVCATLAKSHCVLVCVPGQAKTLLVKTLAQSMPWDFKRIQFTPNLMPGDIIGSEILATDTATGRSALSRSRLRRHHPGRRN
jgi:MoxR-like ATPase